MDHSALFFSEDALAHSRDKIHAVTQILSGKSGTERETWSANAKVMGFRLTDGNVRPYTVGNGAPGRIRTRDLPLTRRLLYQLSYKGTRAPIA